MAINDNGIIILKNRHKLVYEDSMQNTLCQWKLELAEFQNLKTTTKSKFVKCFSSYFKAHRFFNASSVTRCLDYMFNI